MNDPPQILTIYTDGAYSSATEQGGIGIVVVKDGNAIQTFNKGFKNTTNNQMELLAVIASLNAINKHYDEVCIYTDSMYVIGCATKGWKRKKNQSLWKKYDETYSQALQFCENISFCHVKGHEDDTFNNMADKLAVEARSLVL